MVKALREFPASNVVALFDEASGGGDIHDINSLRNRPALTPESFLPNLYFHSSLNYMEVAFDTTVNISHAAFGSGEDTSTVSGLSSLYDVDPTVVDWDAFTHSLGYEPLVLVIRGSDALTPGYPVQAPPVTNGSMRIVSPHVTSTKVFLREFRLRGSTGLSATTLSYRIIVFRAQRAAATSKLIDFDPATGNLSLAKDRINSSRRYLQVVPGGSPLGLFAGRSMDAKNGAPRIVAPDGTVYDPIPDTVKFRISTGNPAYGPPMNYNGTFTGGTRIQVQAP